MRAARYCRDVFLNALRPLARATAYGVVLLLALVWLTSALASFLQPFFDLGKPRVGDAIIAFGGALHLRPRGILELAHMLVGLKLLLGTYLLIIVMFAAYERLRWRRSNDDMLDVGLLVSAIGSIVASAPLVMQGEGVRVFVGELMLCVIASGLTLFARRPRALSAANVVSIAIAPVAAEPILPQTAEDERQAA
jgi:hypothetical protein